MCRPFLLQIFIGNSHRNEIVQHVLVEVARARIIRFQPVDYHIHKALRVEVYGIRIPAGTSVLHHATIVGFNILIQRIMMKIF